MGVGFNKSGSSDSYVLLGGGGHKLESSLSVAYAASTASATYATTAGSANSVAWSNISGRPDLWEFKCYCVDANSSIEFTVGLKGGIVITSCPYWGWNAIFSVNYGNSGGADIIAGGGDQSNLYWVEVYHTSWYNISLTTHEVVNYGHKCYVYAFMAA
jgi:hypothetical protein